MKQDVDLLFYTVWWASRGDELAKRTLWELLVTERERVLIAKLRHGGVREADWEDALSKLALKIYQKIEQLKVARAYVRWEERLLRSECRRWIHDYAILIGPLGTINKKLQDLGGNNDFAGPSSQQR